MPPLRDKVILVVSPQSWGNMFISKHHYAIELARRGNKVYFLNPPEQKPGQGGSYISITPSGLEDNLLFIGHRLGFPYRLRYHALPLFHLLMRPHVKKILKAIGSPVDIVWSFDLGNLYPFRLFGKQSFRIFHPVDEPQNPAAIHSAKGASIIFSVTKEILTKYERPDVPRHVINHGLSGEFLRPADLHRPPGRPLRTCLAGNLLRQDIDRPILMRIIRENPELNFEFLGSFTSAQANVGGSEDVETVDFIKALQQQPNVVLHGAVGTDRLAGMIREMDLFLICYDVKKDQSKGTNYHKIMEYLSAGKVIVSNNVSAYQDRPDLIQMVSEREHNEKLPSLFRQVTGSLDHFNNPSLQSGRIAFALDNTYGKQLDRIEKLLS
jgi:hypothetical protein